ncbi:MAG TPA: DUF1571 domain-containing protein [Flavobacteriales bacterium]|nr:DUF1571 domain-containing protein [Flavobacteriales bacterium]
MKRNNLFGIVLILLISATSVLGQSTMSCKQIVDKMLYKIDQGKSFRYDLIQKERQSGKMTEASQSVKLNVSPYKLYINNRKPNEGAEVLWVAGKNNGKCLVNPNAFPYFNVNLDPMGSLLRRDQHHTVFESGFTFFAKIIRDAIVKAKTDFDKYFKYESDIEWNGRKCYKLVITYDEWRYVPYTVLNGEDLNAIGKKQMVSEYMILHANEAVDDYDDVKAGQEIQIPILYAKRTILYVDKQYFLPIRQEMYDDKGLFEIYEFHNLKVNPTILEEEFSEDYKDYNF